MVDFFGYLKRKALAKNVLSFAYKINKKGDKMMTKIIVVITRGILVATLCLINLNCYTPDPEKIINLNVPYHQQVCSNWCGLACIQMWADFDNINVTQQEIANYIGIDGHDEFVMEWGTYYGGPAYYNPKHFDREPPDHTMVP
jgi:hypothetical protein